MKRSIFLPFYFFAVLLFLSSCKTTGGSQQTAASQQPVNVLFVADSAFAYCQAQCDFGPRTMNSEAHERCAEWIQRKFEEFGCQVELQKADLRGYDGTVLKGTNIIARCEGRGTRYEVRRTRCEVREHESWYVPTGTADRGRTTTRTRRTGRSRCWLLTTAQVAWA